VTAAPPLRVVGVLVAGRVAFRGAVVASAPLLLAAWGTEEFGPYALALGSTLVLNPLVGSGTEKSAGTLLPRARLSRVDGFARRLLAAHLGTAAAIAAGSLLLTAPFALADPDRAGLWLLAGATNVGFGAVQALVAYWRVLGVPHADPVSFGVLAAATGCGVVLAFAAGLGPVGYLVLQAGTAGTVAATLAAVLRARLARPRRRTVRLVARTTTLMGLNTLLATAPVSVVIAVLGGRSGPVAVSHLYVAVTAYTVLGNVLDYLQRVYQPWLTTTLRVRPADVYRPAGRCARLVRDVAAPAGALVVAGSWGLDPPAAALGGMAAIAPVLLAAALLTWVLENAATAALGRTTRAGLAGLATTTLTAVLLAAPLGASGALLGLLAGATVHIALLGAYLRHSPTGNGAHDTRHAQRLDVG